MLKIRQKLNTNHSGHSDNIRRLGSNKGFTLVETLLYVAIIGAVIASFVSFSLSISDSNIKNYVAEEVQVNARIALDLISQKIRGANGVNVSFSSFETDPGVLSLGMADSSKNPTVFNLNQDDGILQIIQGSDAPIAVTSDKVKVSNLVFTNLSLGNDFENIRVEMTVEFNNSSGDVEYTYSRDYQTTVSLRQ